MNHYPNHKNWFQRHWKWLAPLVIMLLSIPVFQSSLGGALKDYGTLYTNPSIYENALTQVREYKEASDFLGIPIEVSFLVEGEIRYLNNGNSATMTIPIKGSNTNAKMDVKADKVNGEWVYKLIRIRTKKPKTKIDIINDE